MQSAENTNERHKSVCTTSGATHKKNTMNVTKALALPTHAQVATIDEIA
jgi:hypothetical protein